MRRRGQCGRTAGRTGVGLIRRLFAFRGGREHGPRPSSLLALALAVVSSSRRMSHESSAVAVELIDAALKQPALAAGTAVLSGSPGAVWACGSALWQAPGTTLRLGVRGAFLRVQQLLAGLG